MTGVVRDWPVAVLDVADQLCPLPPQVVQRLAQQAARYDIGLMLQHQPVEDVEHARTVSSSQPLSSFGFPCLAARLGGEQPADEFDETRSQQLGRTRGLRDVVLRRYKAPPRMCPACEMDEVMALRDAVVRGVAVGHQYGAFANAGEQLVGQLAAATRRIGEHAHGRIRVGHLRPR